MAAHKAVGQNARKKVQVYPIVELYRQHRYRHRVDESLAVEESAVVDSAKRLGF